MTSQSADATPLTLVCPIINGCLNNTSFSSLTRQYLQSLDQLNLSPMAQVPNTFLCRYYILNDVFFEGLPAAEDHLQSKYLVFCCNFHGDLQEYLSGFWQNAENMIKGLWQHCVAFDQVNDTSSFIEYIKKCQVKTTFYFNGSSGAPLQEQLKALYLKQEISQFAVENQNKSPQQLRAAFNEFVERCVPHNINAPAWHPGKSSIN